MKSGLRNLLWSCGLDVRFSRTTERLRQQQAFADRETWLNNTWRTLLRYHARTILDIGAHDGEFAQLIREIDPAIGIVSFEPLESCFSTLEAVLRKLGNATAFRLALGEESGIVDLHRNSWSASSSFLQLTELHRSEWPFAIEETTAQPSPVSRLDDLDQALALIRPPFIVKLDVQGFEDRVLRGGLRTIRQACAVVVESTSYPLYEGQAAFSETYQILKELGFVFRGNIEQCFSRHDRRIVQFDALFDNPTLLDDPTPPSSCATEVAARDANPLSRCD